MNWRIVVIVQQYCFLNPTWLGGFLEWYSQADCNIQEISHVLQVEKLIFIPAQPGWAAQVNRFVCSAKRNIWNMFIE